MKKERIFKERIFKVTYRVYDYYDNMFLYGEVRNDFVYAYDYVGALRLVQNSRPCEIIDIVELK